MSLGEHVCEETLRQSRCQRDFLAYKAFRLPTGNDSGWYTLAACIVNHVGESRPNVVPSMLAQLIRSWEGPWANFSAELGASFWASFGAPILLNSATLGGSFGGRKFGPQI